ncbi:putative sugar phosphate/phosphate translocator [Canna indica]|uniref:Sugar phosphate/phosphate translocator n=1 Tax=Canna indica TaxID=4628 RepID=A0AAQ3Q363_9LILI|nr:putative sugar phosphate/phosphate translocator [Canna indica]
MARPDSMSGVSRSNSAPSPTSLYYVAPCCMALRLVPWALVELPILRDKASFCPDIIVFSTNSCTFTLNLVVFLFV